MRRKPALLIPPRCVVKVKSEKPIKIGQMVRLTKKGEATPLLRQSKNLIGICCKETDSQNYIYIYLKAEVVYFK